MPSLKALLAVAVSAIAFYFSTGLNLVWPLAWVAPLPVLLLALRSSWRVAALVAFAASLLGGFSLAGAYGPIGSLVFGVPPAIGFTAAAIAARVAARRLAPWVAALMFPAAFTAHEFLFSLINPNGTLSNFAYSQTDVLPVLQLTSLTGLWGVLFLLTFVPSAMALAWHRRARSPLILALAMLLVSLGYGTMRLRQAPDAPGMRVGLAATDRGLPEAAITTDASLARSVASAYAGRVGSLAEQGAEIVVLPEKLVGVAPENDDDVINVFSEAARAARVTVVAGVSRNGTQPRRNVALVFSPEGATIAEFEKHYPVPIIERDYARGDKLVLFSDRWGVAICKDLDFPALSRAYGREGVRFLAVPAWDFVQDARMHSRMAVTRGVENGFTIARAAQEGLVTFSDGYGRILSEQASAADPLLVQSIPPGPGATFYTRYGDWFGWASVLMTGALLAGIVRTRPANRSAPESAD